MYKLGVNKMNIKLVEGRDFKLIPLINDINENCEFGIRIEASDIEHRVDDLSPQLLRKLIEQYQLVILSGFQSDNTVKSLTQFSESLGQIMMWPFGAVLELVEQPNATDHIFANSYVPLHWDGMYLENIPELQVFQCVAQMSEDAGGRTTFSSTTIALNRASTETKAIWYQSTGKYQRQVELYKSTVISPIIELHPYNGQEVLRFCEPPKENDENFINPSIYHFETLSEKVDIADLVQSLRNALYDPAAHYAHTWKKGDVIIADNFSLLHGRESYKSQSGRHVRRVHIHADKHFKNPHLAQK